MKLDKLRNFVRVYSVLNAIGFLCLFIGLKIWIPLLFVGIAVVTLAALLLIPKMYKLSKTTYKTDNKGSTPN